MGRVKKFLKFSAVLIVLLALVGWAYQFNAERRDVRDFPPRGAMVDVDGRDIHLYCTGRGAPTVLLEAGLGNMVLAWNEVQSELARTMRVCAYDRSGLGHSEAGPMPRSGESIVADLEKLVRNAGIETPLILVGHSNGALYARQFERRNSEKVAGMLLIDPSPENAETCEKLPTAMRAVYGSLVFTADFGLARLLLPILFPPNNSLSPEEQAEFMALSSRSDFLEALWSEWKQTCALRQSAAAAGPPARQTPVLVLSVSRPEGTDGAAQKLHRQWVDGVPNAELIVVEDSGHWIQRDRPEVVIEAVRQLKERSREK